MSSSSSAHGAKNSLQSLLARISWIGIASCCSHQWASLGEVGTLSVRSPGMNCMFYMVCSSGSHCHLSYKDLTTFPFFPFSSFVFPSSGSTHLPLFVRNHISRTIAYRILQMRNMIILPIVISLRWAHQLATFTKLFIYGKCVEEINYKIMKEMLQVCLKSRQFIIKD